MSVFFWKRQHTEAMILKQFEERTVDAFLTKISEVDKKSNWRIRLRLRYDAVYCLRHYK